jgi:predicted CopG family antitoxin
MSSPNYVRKSVTIPSETYEKLLTFKNDHELFSHFCHRIFALFLERSQLADFERVGISKETFTKLIENYPNERINELVPSLEASLETALGKKIDTMDLKKEIIPYLKKVAVDVDNICTVLDFNFLDSKNEFQMFAASKTTSNAYLNFWSEYLAVFFNARGYRVKEKDRKPGYLYMHFKNSK